VDFFTVPTVTFRVLFVFVVLAHHRRRVVHFNVTDAPTAAWTAPAAGVLAAPSGCPDVISFSVIAAVRRIAHTIVSSFATRPPPMTDR
jgi:hypothetical protein